MKARLFSNLLVTALSLMLMPSAWATWSSFKSLGKTPTVGEPACAQLASKEVVCVTRSQTSTLMANEFNTKWSGWTDLGDTVTSDASCAPDGDGNIVCAAASATGTLTATVFDGTSWSALVDSGVSISLIPSCANRNTGIVVCGARAVNGSFTAAEFKAGAWGKFTTLTASLVSAPGCTSDDDHNVICLSAAIVNNATNAIVNLYDGLKWQGFLTLNGLIVTNPFCAALDVDGSLEGEVICLGGSTNTAYYVNAFNGNGWNAGDWGGWGQLTGNVFPNRASCGLLSSGSITCGFINVQDSLLYADTFNGTNWEGYVKVGTSPIIGGPVCTPYAKGSTMCVVVGLNTQASSATGP